MTPTYLPPGTHGLHSPSCNERVATRVTFGVLLFLLLFFVVHGVQAAAPTLTHVFPAGGQRGAKVAVACKGKFDWPVSIDAPGLEVTVGQDAGKLEISIPADLATDRIWIRMHNVEGASNAVPFLVGSLKEMSELEPNNSPRNAQALAETSVTVNGVLEGADVDGFAVQLDAGQTLVAALDANTRLGSPMDAILQIASTEGNVLAENHDDVGLDPRLVFTPRSAGTFIVRLFAFPSSPDSSIAFRGGENYVYRLTLTTGLFITHAVPMSVPRAEPGTVEVFGWNVPPGTRLPVVPLGGGKLGDAEELEPQGEVRIASDTRLGLAFAPEFGGAARVRLVPHTVIPSLAQGDEQNPRAMTLPTAVTGRLQHPRQTDAYRLPLMKGQSVAIAAEARGLDFPLDPVLQLIDPAGSVAATVDDAAPKRAFILTHTAALDGDYQLTIRDRHRQGNERAFYQLTARLDEPDFELTAAMDALVVAPDKPTEFVVTIQRRGAVGPITVTATDLPPGVIAAAAVSEPTGPTAEKVTLSFTTTGPAFSGRIRISGTASQPNEIKRLARTPPNLSACFESFWLTAIAKP
jgi:hypothetical protein